MSDVEANTHCKCGNWCKEHRDIICGFNEQRDLKTEVERLKNEMGDIALLKEKSLKLVAQLQQLQAAHADLVGRLEGDVKFFENQYCEQVFKTNQIEKIAGELAEAERCENCPDQGFTVRQVGGCDPDGENDTRECVQEQCEFCYTNPKSRFNALASYDALSEEK